MVRLEPGGFVFFHREVAPWGLKTSEALSAGSWHHVAAAYKDGWSTVYVNGSVWARQKEGAQDNNPETPVLVGAVLEKGSAVDFFDGLLDEVRRTTVRRVDPRRDRGGLERRLEAEPGNSEIGS